MVSKRAVEELVETLVFQFTVLLLLLDHLIFRLNRLLFQLVNLFVSIFESALQIGDFFFGLLRCSLLSITLQAHLLEIVTQLDQLIAQVALPTIL